MATINQFQYYSQTENTITNNVLLLFSLLYDLNPKYYEDFINALIEDNEFYKVIPDFNQQVSNNGNGIIDGHISLKSSTIIIETKISGLEWIEKLLKYKQSFNNDSVKLLFHLSSTKYTNNEISEIRNSLDSDESNKNIKFYSITYEDLVSQLKSMHQQHPYSPELSRLYNHFESYCEWSDLLPIHKNTLRAMACGQSYSLNVKHQFYFDLASRGYRPFNYLGIYRNKAVSHIGLVENMIVAEFDNDYQLVIKESTSDVTKEQKERLIKAMHDSIDAGWDIDTHHRFFLLKDFTETKFIKTSPGGIFRVRYFDLQYEFDNKLPTNIKDIAEGLKSLTWE